MNPSLERGVSVVIPSLAGKKSLAATLKSLDAQSLDHDCFEVIVVFNGEGTDEIRLRDIRDRFPRLNLRLFKNFESGAGRARNIGISLSTREFMTFVDDDDVLEEKFLEIGLKHARADRCVLLPIINIDGRTRDHKNTLNVRIQALCGQSIPLSEAPWAMGFNACKFVSTKLMKGSRYDERLRSGEDLVYFAHLLQRSSLKLEVPKNLDRAAYIRSMSLDSVSRKKESFDFHVRQRMECIKALQEIRVPECNLIARQSLEKAQFQFVERYLLNHQGEVSQAIETAIQLGVQGCNWESIRRTQADRLVISYCFPPYADTSANVVSKVIRAQGEEVDVYYANMSRVRSKDESTLSIVAPFVAKSTEIQVAPSFANWDLIGEFGLEVSEAASTRMETEAPYASMYTRALWSGSHVAGALLKSKFPQLHWEAEFSDPLAFGADGRPREGTLTPGAVTDRLESVVKGSPWSALPFESHFELTEIVTMILADQLIFTNANQRSVMLDRFPRAFRDFVESKSLVRHHETPTPEMYGLVECDYEVDHSRANVAYFGNFYGNRGIGEVVEAMERLSAAKRSKIALHIFTSRPEELSRQLEGSSAVDALRINPYVPYLEFLNVSKKFDCLIVNDADTTGSGFKVNPFLPSKYSDYRGSGVPVWGLVVEGSPLSQLPLTFKCESQDGTAIDAVVNEIIERALV